MSEDKTNNPESTPDKGQVEEKAGGSEDISKLSLNELTDEQLEKLVKKPVDVTPEPVNEPEPKEGDKEPEPESEPNEVEKEVADDLKGKSIEEVAKMYRERRKLWDRQSQELNELRKYKKENAALDEELKQYGVNSTAQKLVKKEMLKMTDEQKDLFYEKFSENPAEALMPLITEAIKPITVKQARLDNEAEIKRLEDKAKNSLVPYDRKKINKIIASFTKENGRNELFDKHGKGAFEAAYDIYYKQNIGAALEAREKEIKEKALKEAEEAANKKLNTFTEPQGRSSASVGGKSTNYDAMSDEELAKAVGKPKDKE